MTVSEEIKQRLDIVELIQSSGVQLRKAGRNFTGFCPFHPNARTPAFYVFPHSQSYYCFSCHKSGDAFAFVMDREGLPFGEALQQLAQRAGVTLPERSPLARAAEEQEEALHAKLREINEAAAVYWHHLLRATGRGETGRAYVTKRGLDPATVESWQLGYAPEDWSDLLRYLTDRKSFTAEEVEQAGLTIKRESGGYYDRFRNRLMFPIRDLKGNVVGFGGRALGDDHAKYMNTPETAIFHKGSLLFGLHQARDEIRRGESAVVVEGYLDVITAHQAGFRNVVAPMGTALTPEQVEIIRKLIGKSGTLYLALDADAAGMRAAEKGLDAILRSGAPQLVQLGPFAQGWEVDLDLPVKIIEMPAGQDPDDVIKGDPRRWSELVTGALPVVEFFFRLHTRELDLRNAEHQQRALTRLAPVVGAIKDFAKRAVYENQLAELLRMPFPLIQASVLEVTRQARRTGQGRFEPARRPVPAQPTAQDPYAHEDQLLSLLLRFPMIRERVEATLAREIGAFPDLAGDIPTDLRGAFGRTENRLLWHAWSEHGPNGPADVQAWLGLLEPTLAQQAERLLHWQDMPPLPDWNQLGEARSRATGIAEVLMRTIARRRRDEFESMARSVEDETTRAELAQKGQLVLKYLNAVTAPRRSTVYQDLSTRREEFGN
ncbi:MAG TPA: DNA primase [Herpetosiphonaceae bacterium]|nr:DNA primase [Herpetosiphonaceae bacterium]